MKYVEQVLQPGETVTYATSLHWLVYLRAIVLLILALLVLVAAASLTEPTGAALSIGLSAAIVAASEHEPRVLTLHFAATGGSPSEGLPSGPLEAEHRTLEIGLRTWVERQTSQRLGYVEQLYTFGDRDRVAGDDSRALPALT